MKSVRNVFFDAPIDALPKEDILSQLRTNLSNPSFFRISTVGPEFLLRAREDEKFKKNLLKADLRVADGFGITLAGWLFGRHIERFPGADLLHEILKETENRNFSVFLAVKKGGLSSLDEIQVALLKKYPKLKVTGREFDITANHRVSVVDSSVVFCNFGAPDQEYFLESLRGRSRSVRLAMGVGGAFDFLTGKLPRAPRAFRLFGFEWLWRLFLQPKRWRRAWRAAVVFPAAILKDRFLRMGGMSPIEKDRPRKRGSF